MLYEAEESQSSAQPTLLDLQTQDMFAWLDILMSMRHVGRTLLMPSETYHLSNYIP